MIWPLRRSPEGLVDASRTPGLPLSASAWRTGAAGSPESHQRPEVIQVVGRCHRQQAGDIEPTQRRVVARPTPARIVERRYFPGQRVPARARRWRRPVVFAAIVSPGRIVAGPGSVQVHCAATGLARSSRRRWKTWTSTATRCRTTSWAVQPPEIGTAAAAVAAATPIRRWPSASRLSNAFRRRQSESGATTLPSSPTVVAGVGDAFRRAPRAPRGSQSNARVDRGRLPGVGQTGVRLIAGWPRRLQGSPASATL